MSFPFEQFITESKRLGKSDEFIHECIEYATALTSRELPVIFSIEHLAMLMGVQSSFVRNLIGDGKNNIIYHDERKYRRYQYFKLKKKNGTFREIMSPAKDLKYLQKWLLVNILEQYPLAESCKGFRKKISIFDNAKVHEKAEIILKVDLLKFYDTITEERVFRVFRSMGYVGNLSVSLAKLTTAKHRDSYWVGIEKDSKEILNELIRTKPSILPQGAPTSPMIANIVATVMDFRFEALAKKMSFNYSRYADDLTFSIQADGGRLPSVSLITKIVSDEGFFINTEKTRYMKKGCKQYVTGLTTTNGVNVSKKYRRKIAAHIFYCRRFGVNSHLEKRRGEFPKYNNIQFCNWLYGHLCFIKSINEKASKKMLEDFNKINWSI